MSKLSKAHVVHLVLALVIVAGMRIPYLKTLVINWDESVFFIVAKDLAEGGTLYVTTWDIKEPCLYFILAGAIKVVGSSVFALRTFTTVYVLCSMVVVFFVGLRLFGARGAQASALFFGVFFSTTSFQGLGSMSELFMMLPVSLALLYFLIYLGGESKTWILSLCGAAAAVAMLTKSAAIYSVVAIPFFLLIRQLVHKPANVRKLGMEIVWGISGFIGVLSAILLYFAAKGTLRELFFIYRYNSQYMDDISVTDGWISLALVLGWMATREVMTMLTLAAVAYLALSWRLWPDERWKGLFIFGIVVTSLLGVSLGRNVFFHYYLQMSLGLALSVGFAVSRIEISESGWRRLATAGFVIMLMSTYSPYRFESITRHLDIERDQNLREVADYLQRHSAPEETIFVLGGEPILYLMADRSAPTRYFFWLYHWGRFAQILRDEGVDVDRLLIKLPDWFVFRQTGEQERVLHLEDLMYSSFQPVATIGQYQIARRLDGRQE